MPSALLLSPKVEFLYVFDRYSLLLAGMLGSPPCLAYFDKTGEGSMCVFLFKLYYRKRRAFVKCAESLARAYFAQVGFCRWTQTRRANFSTKTQKALARPFVLLKQTKTHLCVEEEFRWAPVR